MTTAGIAEDIRSKARRVHGDANIVFGSAATAPTKKPDSVRATCQAIGLARSTYYYQSHRCGSAIELEQRIVLRLHELRDTHPNDGYRRMTLQLRAEGFHVNRKRIARLMQLHGLVQRQSKADGIAARRTQQPIASSRTTQLTGPNQSWVTDISYAHIQSGLVYASAVIDAWSAEVVGYAASLQITNRLASIALHCAARAHRPVRGCILHSNWGAHPLERSYYELLRHYGLIPSVREDSSQCPRHIVNVGDYETWKDVIDRPREFIQTLYSPERVDCILSAAPNSSRNEHSHDVHARCVS